MSKLNSLKNQLFYGVAVSAMMSIPAVGYADEGSASVEEQVKTIQEDVSKLKGVKVNGFVQTRFELSQLSKNGVMATDGVTPANKDFFSIRRGRIRASYTGSKWFEAAVHIDAVPTGVTLYDTTVSITEPWSPAHFKFTLGQFVPTFGYELGSFPEPNREQLERPAVVEAFFPALRDRGISISSKFLFFELSLALVNGNGVADNNTKYTYPTWDDKDADGVQDADELVTDTSSGTVTTTTTSAINFGTADRDRKKDFVARLGFNYKDRTGLGVSLYQGKWGKLSNIVKDKATGTYLGVDDLEYIDKTRLGFDLRAGYSVPKLGLGQVRAEYLQGHGIFSGGKELDVDARGFSVLFVQNIGKRVAISTRLDQIDPNLDADDDTTLAVEPVVMFLPHPNIKLSAHYRIIKDHEDISDTGELIDKKNNTFVLQLMGKF